MDAEGLWQGSCAPEAMAALVADGIAAASAGGSYTLAPATQEIFGGGVPGSSGDGQRVRFLRAHLAAVHDAMSLDHVDVRGYFIWSFMDNFEWAEG